MIYNLYLVSRIDDLELRGCPINRDGGSIIYVTPMASHITFFFSIYLLQVEDRSDITTNFRTENNHIGYYPWRSII